MKPVTFLSLLGLCALGVPLFRLAATISAAPVGAVLAPWAAPVLLMLVCLWLAFLATLTASLLSGA